MRLISAAIQGPTSSSAINEPEDSIFPTFSYLENELNRHSWKRVSENEDKYYIWSILSDPVSLSTLVCLLIRKHSFYTPFGLYPIILWHLLINFFLDATSHLYKRLCPSVRRSVGPPVRWSRVVFEGEKYAY